eukprot:Skav207364  [mRNA]  locus=scaffold426:254609:255849:- [translate_table: standard]
MGACNRGLWHGSEGAKEFSLVTCSDFQGFAVYLGEICKFPVKVNQNCSKTRENMAISLLQLGCRHLQRKDGRLDMIGRCSEVLHVPLRSVASDVGSMTWQILFQELKEASKALKQALSFNSRLSPNQINLRNDDIYFNLGVLFAEKENSACSASSAPLSSEMPSRKAANDFPSLLTVRKVPDATSIHFQKRIEGGSRDSVRGRAALLEAC